MPIEILAGCNRVNRRNREPIEKERKESWLTNLKCKYKPVFLSAGSQGARSFAHDSNAQTPALTGGYKRQYNAGEPSIPKRRARRPKKRIAEDKMGDSVGDGYSRDIC